VEIMLCGTRVSLVTPETEHRALEELAGEKPYNKTSSSGGSKKSPVLSFMRSSPLSPVADGDQEGGRRGHVRPLALSTTV